MSAYIVFMREQMTDRQAYDKYIEQAAPTLAAYQGEIIVFNGESEALEGNAIDGSVILHFPDMEKARAWYRSPEYSRVKDMRINATVGRAVLLNGVSL